MIFKFRSFTKKITNKIILLSIGGILFLGIVLSLFSTYQLYKSSTDSLIQLETSLDEEFDLSAKEKVQAVRSLIDAVYAKHLKGEYTLQEAKDLCASIVREIRYGEVGYFWIDTREGVNVVYKGLDAEGKNRIEAKDSDGKLFIKEIIDKAVAGGGYTEYRFPKKGMTEPMPKRSYSLYFEPFDWIIGTGNYVDDIEKIIDRKRDEASRKFWNSIILLFVFILFAFMLSGYIALVIGKRITKPIVDLSEKAEEIAKGKLSVEIDIKQDDEVGKLAKSFHTMISQLKNTIESISESIENVSRGSEQISISAQEIAQGSNEQASSAEEISTSIEQIASTISQSSENAQITEKIALKAEMGILKGQDATKATLNSMLEIAEKINIISKIAEKTDLLAINAAIEASKAGERGKGFGVVATEIRQLSINSQKSANEINELTTASVLLARQSDKIFTEIAPDVKKTAELVQEISAANIEQLSSINHITQAILQFNTVVQQNSSTAEELFAGSEELASQGASLKEAIGFFSLTSEHDNMKRLYDKVMTSVNQAFKSLSIDEMSDFEFTFKKMDDRLENEILEQKIESSNGVDIKLEEQDENDFETF